MLYDIVVDGWECREYGKYRKRLRKMAKLYYRYGAMGSSKSANILMVRYNYEERKIKKYENPVNTRCETILTRKLI